MVNTVSQRFSAIVIALSMTFALASMSGCSSKQPKVLPLSATDNSVETDIVWRRNIGEGSGNRYTRLAPVVVDDRVFAADPNGTIQALTLDNGRKEWSVKLEAPISGGVAVWGEQLFVSTEDAQLYALDTQTGDVQWSTVLTSESVSPVGGDERRVFAHTVDGRITAFEKEDGSQAWSYKSALPVLTVRGTSQPVVIERLLLVGLSSGKVLALDKVLGAPRWETRLAIPDGRSELERLVDIDGSVVIDKDTIYSSSYHGNIAAINPQGKIVWEEEGSGYTKPALSFGSLYQTLEDGSIQAYDGYNGAKGWRQSDLVNRNLGGVVVASSYLAVVDGYGFLHVLSQVDGRLVGRELLRPSPIHKNLPNQSEATNWRALRNRNFGSHAPLVATDDGVLVYTNAGELIRIEITAADKS